MENLLVGARWDDSEENTRFLKAKEMGLVDYVEVNYPIAKTDDPYCLDLPIFVHTSNNALCNAVGVDNKVLNLVKEGVTRTDTPWVGEHLSYLGYNETGALGYVINPLFIEEFSQIAINNTKRISEHYNSKIALELGPLYTLPLGDFRSELDFLNYVAAESGAHVILDLTHWTISNLNLKRDLLYGLDHLDTDNVVEIHLAGMRKSKNEDIWHDSHGSPMDDTVLNIFKDTYKNFSNLQAITLEHSITQSDDSFINELEKINTLL